MHLISDSVAFFQVIDIMEDEHVSLMDDGGSMREDLKLPDDDIGKEIKDKFEKDTEILVCTVIK